MIVVDEQLLAVRRPLEVGEVRARPGSAIARGLLSPDWSAIMSWCSPLASESHASCAPSGDHAGFRSCAPGDFVRLRQSPLSVGTVKMSPRASKAARTPVGESARVANHARHALELRRAPTGNRRRRRWRAAWTGRSSRRRDGGSPPARRRWRRRPADAFMMSKSSWCVSCLSFFVARSYENRFVV